MKKLSLLFCSLFFLTISLFAQQTKYEVGVEGGPSLITLWGDEFISAVYNPTIGFSGGLSFQYNLTKSLSIRTNLAYEKKGASLGKIHLRDDSSNDLGYVNVKDIFNYLTLPILVRASVGNKVKFFANAGMFFGYLTKQTTKQKASDSYYSSTNDNTSNYKRLDIGATIGGGIAIPIGDNFVISGELRENLGLAGISKNSSKLKTTSTNLLFGLAYKLGKK